MVPCGLAWALKSLVQHALYGVACIQARPQCILFFQAQQSDTCHL